MTAASVNIAFMAANNANANVMSILSPYYLSSSLFMLNAIITMQAMASVMVVTAKAIRKLIIVFDHLGEQSDQSHSQYHQCYHLICFLLILYYTIFIAIIWLE